MNMKKKHIVLFLSLAVLILVVAWVAYANVDLEVNKLKVKIDDLPSEFDNFKIAQISDLHNAQFGENNEKLLAMLKQTEPDIIAITGDVVDSRRTNVDVALNFAEEAVKIAPVYYVNGNHEARISEYGKLKQGFTECGVTVLENKAVELTAESEVITLIGITDLDFSMGFEGGSDEQKMINQLMSVIPDNDTCKILLAHRPEYFPCYIGKAELVLSGHAHGGQFILPFVGGVLAPGQGLFPKYYTGLYSEDGTNMVVSRGLGNSLFPFRLNNKPEIVVVQLTK